MNDRRVEVERGVVPDERAVRLGSAGHVLEPRSSARPSGRQDLGLERLAIAAEGRDDDLLDRGQEIRPEGQKVARRPILVGGLRRLGELPVGDRMRREAAQLVHDSLGRLPDRDQSVGECMSQVRDRLVEIRAHRSPAGDHVPAVLRSRYHLVVDEVGEGGLRSVQRTHIPLVQVGLTDRDQALEHVDEHLVGDSLPRAELRRVEPIVVAMVTEPGGPFRMVAKDVFPERVGEAAKLHRYEA